MTREQFDEACKRADEKMKAKDGHTFMTILKTRCMYCGRSPRQPGRCRAWFMTFVNLLYYELYDSSVRQEVGSTTNTPEPPASNAYGQ